MESIQIKLELENNSLRRVTCARSETLVQLKERIASLVGEANPAAMDLKYRDEENDLVTVGSDQELRDLLEDHLLKGNNNKSLRLTVSSSGLKTAADQKTTTPTPPNAADQKTTTAKAADKGPQASFQQQPQQQQQPAPENDDFPWANLARAMADPQTVRKLQEALQRPVVTEAVSRAARGYADSRGDVMMAGLSAAPLVPALLALLAELMVDLPVLRDLQTMIVQHLSRHMQQQQQQQQFPFFAPFFRPPHPHPHPHHPHHPHQPQENSVQKHFGVVCDGCSSDDKLKRAAVAAGHQTRRGFIRGTRFKSRTLDDFDLCESCRGNVERFPEAVYGPFDVVHGSVGCGRGGWGARGQQQDRPWRCRPAADQQQQSQSSCGDKTNSSEQDLGDFVEAIRSAVIRGTEAFVEATKAVNSNDEDIANAIAESLKETLAEEEKPKTTTTSESPSVAEDWEKVPASSVVAKGGEEDPFVKWSTQLTQLEALGFENLETYIEFLEQEKGDLDRVVARIVSKEL